MKNAKQRGSSNLHAVLLVFVAAVVLWLVIPAAYPDLRGSFWQFAWLPGTVLCAVCAMKEASHVA